MKRFWLSYIDEKVGFVEYNAGCMYLYMYHGDMMNVWICIVCDHTYIV